MRISVAKAGLFLMLSSLLLVTQVTGQVKGESYLNWYSWNAGCGFMMPMNIFNSNLTSGITHSYRYDGTPGFLFAIGKPLGVQVNVGIEMEDQRSRGAMKGFNGQQADTFYHFRSRTYSLYVQYYILPGNNITPFVMGKAGYGGLNRSLLSRDLSRSLTPDRWEFMLGGATGVSWHSNPNLTFNLYGEVSTIPARYLPQLFTSLPSQDKKFFATTRVVLSITGHTDIRVYYPFKRSKAYRGKYKTKDYLPYNRIRNRN